MKMPFVTIAAQSVMDHHKANGGEKLAGNINSIKIDSLGRAYISGRMEAHAIMEAIRTENDGEGGTFVSVGEAPNGDIQKDLRSDLRGFMFTSQGQAAQRRNAVLACASAIGDEPARITYDLGARHGESQMPFTSQMSDRDLMTHRYALDVEMMGRTRTPDDYEDGRFQSWHEEEHYGGEERLRRAKMVLEAATGYRPYANQASNLAVSDAVRCFIALRPKRKAKAVNYFSMSEKARERLLAELEAEGAEYFLGDDDEGEMGVYEAVEAAKAALEAWGDHGADAAG